MIIARPTSVNFTLCPFDNTFTGLRARRKLHMMCKENDATDWFRTLGGPLPTVCTRHSCLTCQNIMLSRSLGIFVNYLSWFPILSAFLWSLWGLVSNPRPPVVCSIFSESDKLEFDLVEFSIVAPTSALLCSSSLLAGPAVVSRFSRVVGPHVVVTFWALTWFGCWCHSHLEFPAVNLIENCYEWVNTNYRASLWHHTVLTNEGHELIRTLTRGHNGIKQ